MKLKVLGCSGGISGDLRTTSFLVDDDILIDAGTGVGCLDFEALSRIDHVFLTHSHLDHVTSLPFLVDTVGGYRDRPLTVHAPEEVLAILREHLFNWKLWPDFNVIPSAEAPYMVYCPVSLGESVELGGRRITPLPARHVVPAVGYWLDSGAGSLVFTGDTGPCDALWDAVNDIGNLRYLIIETAFCNKDLALARAAQHLCPSLLAEELAKLTRLAEVYITHLKPAEIERTMREIERDAAAFAPQMLRNGLVLNF